jgi:hypothetical protein
MSAKFIEYGVNPVSELELFVAELPAFDALECVVRVRIGNPPASAPILELVQRIEEFVDD